MLEARSAKFSDDDAATGYIIEKFCVVPGAIESSSVCEAPIGIPGILENRHDDNIVECRNITVRDIAVHGHVTVRAHGAREFVNANCGINPIWLPEPTGYHSLRYPRGSPRRDTSFGKTIYFVSSA